MKLNPKPQQIFLILSMLFGETTAEREPTWGKAPIDRKLRHELELAGLIRTERRGRANHVVLEDDAWDFAVEHLSSELPKTEKASQVLSAVLARLQRFLEARGHAVAEFVTSTTPPDDPAAVDAAAAPHRQSATKQPARKSAEKKKASSKKPPAKSKKQATTKGATKASLANASSEDIARPSGVTSEDEIRAACLSLTGGSTRQRVRLKDLRLRLPLSRESLDRLLQRMQIAGSLVLYKLDNPAEITPEDEAAALYIAGQPRHLVYLEA